MNYLAYIFWNHLIKVVEERRVIDGKEEVCLVIPTTTNQMKRGKNGNWMSIFNIAETPPNSRMQTHDVRLFYLSREAADYAKAIGVYNRTFHLGRVYEYDHTPEKKLDRTNRAKEIFCDGILVLSDIPKELIFANAENSRRYISNLVFRAISASSSVFSGSICLDDIPRQDIFVNVSTGKKYVKVRFMKLPQLDTYMNTHQLVIMRADGTEIEIGRFKEWVKPDSEVKSAPPTSDSESLHTTTVNQRPLPEEYGGIKF